MTENAGAIQQSRIAIVSIIVEDISSGEKINKILSEHADYIVGRMGIPYRQKAVSVLCVAVDAPMEIINSLTGKIGMLPHVSAKTVVSKK